MEIAAAGGQFSSHQIGTVSGIEPAGYHLGQKRPEAERQSDGRERKPNEQPEPAEEWNGDGNGARPVLF